MIQTESKMKVNLTWNVCRICLYESNELQSIYETDEQNQLISDKIALCGGILIDKDLNLPHLICRKCVAFLSVAYKFHVNCQNSDKLLRAFVLDLNSEENFSKSFNEYVAQESAKTQLHESYLKVEAAGSTEHVEEYLIDIDENSLPEIKENILVNDEQEKVQTEDVGTDDWFAAENSFSSESELQESPKKKKKPTRRKNSKRKPTNTITLGLDGSAVIKPAEEAPLHICEVCGNKYTKKFALDNHMKWHRDEKPYACEICGKGFIINFQLTRHMRTHTGQKPYQCKFCGRKFSDLSTCIKHQRTHTNERPFKCETCGKAFNYSHVLKVHLAVHTGEKPYNCDLCGKAFSQLHHLKAHLNTLIHQSNPAPPQPNQQSKGQQKKPARRRKNQAEENTNLQSIIAMLDNEQDSIKVDSD